MPHTNTTHAVEAGSQTLSPPFSSPLLAIPLLTFVSSIIIGSSSNQHESQQLMTLPVYDVLPSFTNEPSQIEFSQFSDQEPSDLKAAMHEQSFHTSHDNIEPNPLSNQTLPSTLAQFE